MVVVQLVGMGSFIVASLVLGTKLLALSRRTGEAAERWIGLSFLLGGGLGYIAWFVAAVLQLQDASPSAHTAVLLAGLGFSCGGSLSNGFGVARIYRAGQRAPLVGLAFAAAWMTFGWLGTATTGAAAGSSSFWIALLACAPVYTWGGCEAAALARTLHKRAKLGLADPVVVNRVALWAVASFGVVMMIAISFGSRLVHGVQSPHWVATVNACIGLTVAAAIWLGFFPPRSLRDRLAKAYAS